jgi:glycosyltransferase involved in cell wall biosynthesis
MAVTQYTALIPAYNAEATLAEAIRSILAQSAPPVRVIVVDDGSSDRTLEVAQGHGDIVKAVSQPNAGPGSATTRGFAMVETPFVATLDADDLWVAGKAARQIDYLERHPDVAAVFTKLANFRGTPDAADYANAYDGWLRTTMMIRTPIALATGPVIDPAGMAGDMVDWLARLRENGNQTVMIPEVLALRRVHPGSLSDRSRVELGKSYLQVAREAMLRRRSVVK